jgi:SAM-dependent methyltransferase
MTTARLETLYRLVEGETPSFLRTVTEAVASAHNEREFQTKVTRAIEEFAKKVGVDLLFREEYTLAPGRADAVYNRLVIEYEKPGSMRADLDHAHTRHAVNQVKQYIEEVAKRERHDQDRLLGIAWDGQIMIFARYRDGHWYEEPPLQVNRQSATRFLRSLVSLSSGRALIPENLVEDFGAQHLRSQRVARALYHALDGHTNDLTANLFRQWQLFFSQVSGYEEASARLRDKKELRQFARGMGLRPETTDPPRLFFTIHTYFSFLVKAIARLVLESYAGGQLGTTPMTVLANLEGESLKRELERLEDGGIFHTLGLMNLLEGDFFSWYLQAWSPEVEDALRLVLAQLSEYNPATIQDDPFAARDLLKKLYHYLLPRELRHDLGEYYTPDWLAERVLSQLNEPLYTIPKADRQPATLFPARRLLDPACGSGTFLVLTIRAIKENCARQGMSEAHTLNYILENVVGIDLNPLAVMAARVNYILAIADLIKYRRNPIVIPVYLADSIKTPAEGQTLFEQGMPLDTVVGKFLVPRGVNTRESISKLTDLLDEYVSAQFKPEAFVERARKELKIAAGSLDETNLLQLYEQLLDLEKKGLDGIWARVLKNAFMPLFIGQFDYVAGNPPWVNWENLPEQYRSETLSLWHHYDFIPPGGFRSLLGESKTDLSTLMTYVAMDKYLKDGGKLAFVITGSVYKTSGAAQGFRTFKLPGGVPLRVIHVDDMNELQPFEGATNRTSVVIIQKGQPTRYPVSYTYWRKAVLGIGVDYDSDLEEVFSIIRQMHFQAITVSADDITSPWLTARPGALKAIQKALGRSEYEAHAGVYTGGANGVFWVEVLATRPDGLLVVRNITEGAKREVESITAEIEPDLVYPLLRGRDVQRWRVNPKAHIIVSRAHAMKEKTFSESDMQTLFPNTYKYLKHFEPDLRKRRDSILSRAMKQGIPYYAMSAADVHFAPYKVIWRYIATELTSA